MPIFVQKAGERLVPLEKTGFPREVDLQGLFFRHPEALALTEIKEGARFMALDREFPTLAGPIDLLLVDDEGELYLVETKLFRNADKRQVVAQVLDYGAALWSEYGDDPDGFIKTLEARLASSGGLSNRLAEAFEEPEDVLQGMRDSVSTGGFRFVVVMDSVPDELKRMVEYLNRMSRFTFYAVEVEHYALSEEDVHIYVQNVYGAAVKISAGVLRKKWDEERFFADLSRRTDPTVANAVRRLMTFAQGQGAIITWGTGFQRGSLIPKFRLNLVGLRAPFFVRSDGTLVIQFGLSLGNELTLRWIEGLRRSLAAVPFLAERVSKLPEELNKFPEFAPAIWVPHTEALIEGLRAFLVAWNSDTAAEAAAL